MAITITLSLVLGGIACGAAGSEPSACSTFTTSTAVEMDDVSYGPACVQVDAGSTLALDNVGAAPHTFTVEGTEVSVDVAAGTQGSADLSGVAAGTYTVLCTYHPQMKATIEVG
ncbi:MAG: cupredoxin domain-containing protein [Myxococcota bacterium]